MIFNSIDDIEKRLNELYKFPLQQIGRNVGVARFYALRMDELREAILSIAKGEVAPLPINKWHICNVFSQHNQKIIDAVLKLNQANSQSKKRPAWSLYKFLNICYNDDMEKITNNKIKCSFIGHRNVSDRAKVASLLRIQLVSLIEMKGVNSFLFGSRSEFDDICHEVVTELRERYPTIERIAYTCRSEWACMEHEREEHERGFSALMHKPVSLKGYEDEVEFAEKYNAGKASYIERNQAMIDDSDYCVFYFNENYSPHGSARSGTKIAYDYALRKTKLKPHKLKILNIYPKD